MKKRIHLSLILFFFFSISLSLFSTNQNNNEELGARQAKHTIKIYVLDEDGEPVVGANVLIEGESLGASTDIDGKLELKVNENAKLNISYVGYAMETITVKKSTEIYVNLKEDENLLRELEITGEFGLKRVARSVGSSAQNVKASEIVESGRDNFISALQGRVSGMNISSTGGSPGASTTVVLRNITSISGNNQPLYVVDGIPMNNSTFDPSSGFATDAMSARDLDFSSRGNDFNSDDIESVTVLKGAAAAALYGSDASNGAIIITTKKGTNAKGKVSYSNSFRVDNAYGIPEIQKKYANGEHGTTNFFYPTRHGGLYPEGTKLYDNVSAVFQPGITQRHNVSVESGNETSSIRAAGSFIDQTGVIKTTAYSRFNLSLSGKSKITDWLSFESSMQYASSKNNKARIGLQSPLALAMQWPLTDDMSNYLDADGSHMRNPDPYTQKNLLNPLFGLNRNKFYDESERFISNFTLIFEPIENVFVRTQLGWDIGMQTFETSMHPYYSVRNEGDGFYNQAKRNFSDPTINIIAGYNNSFLNEKISFSAQAGYHQLENGVSSVATYGTKFIVPDFQSINNSEQSTVVASKRTTKRRIQAISAQVEAGYDNLFFLTLRARNDWSSTLPVEHNSFFYPAMEASFILTELPFLKDNTYVNYLKLRGSLAQVGKDAGPLEIDPQLEATALTGGGFKYGYTGPNKNLKPEMTTAREIGFEGRFFDNRINADFTYFGTHCEDQIVKGFRLSYATGFVLNNMNVGAFKTWGWEAHVDGDIIRGKRGLRWNVGVNLSKNNSEVVSLPDNVKEYYNPLTWNSGNIRNGIKLGHPVTTITGRSYERNEAGEVLINPRNGLPVVSSDWEVLGDREPKLRFGLTTSFDYMGFRMSALFSGRFGATVVNGTKRAMMSTGTSLESVKMRELGPVVFNGVYKDGNEDSDTPTPNNIGVNFGVTKYSGGDEDWVEKNVNYLRLSELRFSYKLPTKVLRKTNFISSASVFVAGSDLFTFTNYSGIDAVGNTVSAAAGGTGGEGYDVWALPNPRGLSVGFNLTFN